MDSSTKNALFIVGIVLSTIVVAFVSLLIGAMVISPAEPEEQPVAINFYIEEDAEDVFTLEGKIGERITLPTAEECEFEKEGYTLKNWVIEEDEEVITYNPGDQITLEAGLSFYGVWEENVPDEPTPTMYTVKLFADSTLQNALLTTEVEENTNFTFPTIQSLNYQKQGFEFVCWSDGENTYNPTQTIQATGNLNFYAVWEEQQQVDLVTITFYDGDYYPSKTEVVGTKTLTKGQQYTLPQLSDFDYDKNQHNVKNYDVDEFRIVAFAEIDEENVSYYSPGKKIQANSNLELWVAWYIPRYEFNFYLEYGQDPVYATETSLLEEFTVPEISEFTDDAELIDSFLYWRASGKEYDSKIHYPGEVLLVESDINFHAVYGTKYTISLYVDENYDELIASYEVNKGDSFTFPNFGDLNYEREGYTFVYWNAPDKIEYVNDDFDIYGVWEENEPEEYIDEQGVVYHQISTPTQGYELFDAKDLENDEYEIPETINGLPVISISDDPFNDGLQKLKIRATEIIENIDSISENIDIYVLPKYFEKYHEFMPDKEIYPMLDDSNIIDETNCVNGVDVANGYYTDSQGVEYRFHTKGDSDYRKDFGDSYWSVYDVRDVTGTKIKFLSAINGIPVKAIYKNVDVIRDDNVEELYIPRNIIYISIENAAISSWQNLRKITVQEGNIIFDSRDNCNAICDCKNRLIVGCKTTIIPNSITEIDGGAFYACRGLNSVLIPNSVVKIGDSAFAGCVNIETASLGNNVKIINSWAFYNCLNLRTINLPNSLTEIGFVAFANTALTTISIPSSVITIGMSSFAGTKLTSVEIPSSVTTIENDAFARCEYLSRFSGGNNKFIISFDGRCLIESEGSANTLIGFAAAGLSNYTIPGIITYINCEIEFEGSLIVPAGVISISNCNFNKVNTVKLLGRTELYHGKDENYTYRLLISSANLDWYCQLWEMSTEQYYWVDEEVWDEDLEEWVDKRVRYENEDWYGNYNIQTY